MGEDCVVVPYPIPGNDVGGRIFIYGLLAAKKELNETKQTVNVLFFCGGFPDNCSTFQPLAERFCMMNNETSNSRMICGVTCLPGFDTHHNNFKIGYTFDEMAVSLQAACKVLLTTVNENFVSKQSIMIKLTGIFHDWGSYAGAMVVNRCNHNTPNYFMRVVYFDVLPPTHPKLRIQREPMDLYKSLIIASYTSLFALCHIIQRYLSYWLAAPVASIGYSFLFILGLLPIRWIDHKTVLSKRPKEFTIRKVISMQYPYYELWRGLLYQGPKRFVKTTMSDATLPENVSNVDGTPILYMYGTNKNAMFHDVNVIAWLKQQNSQSVVPVNNAGHWLYRQQENICYEAIRNFIDITAS
jgi:pimeloyl-ACP methyl ester carboxylesterase